MTDMLSKLSMLKELTGTLPGFPAATSIRDGFKEHQMTYGTSFSWDLLNRPEISCAHWFSSQGSKFPEHIHEGTEWIIVFKGSMHLAIGGDTEILAVGSLRIIEPSVSHSFNFLEDCHYLAIVIPKTSDWPTS